MFPAVLEKATRRIWTGMISVLFPLYCVSCGVEGAWCCQDCLSFLPKQAVLSCPGCPKVTIAGRTCERCRKSISLDGLVAASSYADPAVRSLIKALKFDGAKETLPFILRLSLHARGVLMAALREAAVIPVPLHQSRERTRGYNQAVLIAKKLFPDFEYLSGALLRVKKTKPQTEFEEDERRKNIAGAFCAARSFSGETLLLVDDVYTTGATMNEAARVLKAAGAGDVWGFVVARG